MQPGRGDLSAAIQYEYRLPRFARNDEGEHFALSLLANPLFFSLTALSTCRIVRRILVSTSGAGGDSKVASEATSDAWARFLLRQVLGCRDLNKKH